MTVIVLLINYPKSTITVVHWNDDSNETLFSSYLLGPQKFRKAQISMLPSSSTDFSNFLNFEIICNNDIKIPFWVAIYTR